jgi:hypothetical protein
VRVSSSNAPATNASSDRVGPAAAGGRGDCRTRGCGRRHRRLGVRRRRELERRIRRGGAAWRSRTNSDELRGRHHLPADVAAAHRDSHPATAAHADRAPADPAADAVRAHAGRASTAFGDSAAQSVRALSAFADDAASRERLPTGVSPRQWQQFEPERQHRRRRSARRAGGSGRRRNQRCPTRWWSWRWQWQQLSVGGLRRQHRSGWWAHPGAAGGHRAVDACGGDLIRPGALPLAAVPPARCDRCWRRHPCDKEEQVDGRRRLSRSAGGIV